MTFDPKLLSCTVPDSNKSRTVVTADEKTVKSLTEAYWPITCRRLPQQTKNETIYPRADISITTTQGSFLLPIAADAEYPDTWSSDLSRQISEIKSALPTISQSKEPNGCMILPALALQMCWGVQDLTDGSRAWTKNFDFAFAQPFKTPPIVTPGINTNSDGNAPAVYNFTVTVKGYSGSVNNMLTASQPQTGI